jgi:hypothetical protein
MFVRVKRWIGRYVWLCFEKLEDLWSYGEGTLRRTQGSASEIAAKTASHNRMLPSSGQDS